MVEDKWQRFIATEGGAPSARGSATVGAGSVEQPSAILTAGIGDPTVANIEKRSSGQTRCAVRRGDGHRDTWMRGERGYRAVREGAGHI